MKYGNAVRILPFLLLSWTCQNAISQENFGQKTDGNTSRVKPELPPYCECSFSKNSYHDRKPFLLWSFYESASIRKKNKYVDLENIEEKMGKTLGEAGAFSFSNTELVLNGKVNVTKTCTGQEGHSCETTYYKGNVEIIEGNKKSSFPVWGSCGC